MAVLVNTDGTLQEFPSAKQALHMLMKERAIEWHTVHTTEIPDAATPWESSLLEITCMQEEVCKERHAWLRHVIAAIDENGRAQCELNRKFPKVRGPVLFYVIYCSEECGSQLKIDELTTDDLPELERDFSAYIETHPGFRQSYAGWVALNFDRDDWKRCKISHAIKI